MPRGQEQPPVLLWESGYEVVNLYCQVRLLTLPSFWKERV